MRDFRELKVWEKAHELTLLVYRLSGGFPRSELYGLTSQLRRASASLPANLAEGCGKDGNAEFARYCSIAMGSASELEYLVLLARDLGLVDPADYEKAASGAVEVKRMLAVLMQKVRAHR